MHIEHEPRIAKRLRTQSRQPGDIERLEDRVDADPVAVLNPVGEIHRLAVHQNEIDLDVGHAEGLDAVLDGCDIQEIVLELRETAIQGQKVIQQNQLRMSSVAASINCCMRR